MTPAPTLGRRAVALGVAALLVGCSNSGPGATGENPAPPPSGIVVVSFEEPSSPVVGFIDPSSGRYLQGATLNIAPRSFGPADRRSIRLAPDWSRFAISRQVGDVLHAGWVDPQARFTDVTESASGSTSFEALGFDAMGNFFYRADGDRAAIFRVPSGQTSAAVPVGYLPAVENTVFQRDGSGRLVDVSACPTFAADWITPTDYVHVSADGTQLFRTNIGDTPGLVDCGAPVGTPLLPPGDRAQVSNPVASPDGTTVAYLRNDTELWTVDATGQAPPTRVNVSGIDLGAGNRTLLAGWAAPNLTRPPDFSKKPDLWGTWNGDYFSPRLTGTGFASFHVDRSDPVSGSIVTKSGDLTCNSAAKEVGRTPDTLTVQIELKPGSDPRCRGRSTIEFAWLGEQLSGVITDSSERSYIGGTLIVRRG